MKRIVLLLFIIIVFLIGGCSGDAVDSYESAPIIPDSTSPDSNSTPKIQSESQASSEPITSATDGPPDAVFYQEYGFSMSPDLVPESEHEKEFLKRLRAAIKKDIEEASIDDRTKAMPPDPILTAYFYNDFDNDGSLEMFASECSAAAFGIWFVNDKEAVLLFKSAIFCPVEEPVILEIQDSKFVIFKAYGDVSSTRDYMYGVRDGISYETSISQYTIDGKNQYGEVLVIQTTYDVRQDGSGRTWKPYYFYMDEAGIFKEYGGIETSLDHIYTLNGAQEILKEHLPESAEVTSVYYRDNGIIDVNYIADHPDVDSSVLLNNYITLRFDGVKTWLEQQGLGIYLASYMPKLATFPATLPDNK